MTLHARLERLAASQPDAPCLPGLTWQAFFGAVAALAARLAPFAGQVVAVAAPEGPEQAIALVGTLLSGAVALPLPPNTPTAERERLLAGLAVALILDTPTPDLPPGIWSPPSGDAPALLLATSGSTGEPKRVAHRTDGLVWNALAHADAIGLPAGARTLVTSSLAHAFPLVAQLLATLLRGGSVHWPAGAFTPRAFTRQVEADAIGYAALPPILLRLLAARNPDAAGLPPLLSVGAAPIPADEFVTLATWAARGGSRLYHTYGLSEAGPRVATLAPEDLPAKAHTVGRPLPGVAIRVVAEGRDVPPGEPGEVWLKSPSTMAGYYPAYAGLAADGWLPTGDLGRLDADGFLQIEGRLKDVIVCGGVTIWAREIEDALVADPLVAEAAVVARPDAAYGEAAVAFVVPRAPVTPADVLSGLTERLSRPKLPHEVVVTAALPRTTLGKVDKARLREAACGGSR